MAKTPLELADQIGQLNRENRRNTLNKRINYKGNYENYITGGSHALDNQNIWDRNNVANTMTIADPNGIGADWTLPRIKNNVEGLNDRYTNPQHNERAGNAPYDSGLKYIHRYTPSTRRGRRISDIFFESGRQGIKKSPLDLAEFQALVNKYEKR